MDYNEYYVEWYARELLETARVAARRRALVPPHAPVARPALATWAAALRGLYARWFCATSTGSKPTTARA